MPCNSSKEFSQLVFIILLSLFITTPAYAGTFYVRPDGNDLNPGTANTPQDAWATIQKAADTVNPSDIVEVQPGTYNEQVTITRSGASNQYITFKAQGEVIIDGQNTNPYCIKLDGADYIKLEGFTVRNSTQTGILIDNNANYNLITTNTSYNNPNIGIKLDHDSNYNTISNNTLYNNKGGTSAYGNRICGIYVFNYSDYNTIDSNIAYQNGTGIWLEGRANNSTVTNNKTYSNSYIGIIVVDVANNIVLNNLIYSNYNSGMHIGYSAQNNTVKNNTIYKNGVHGIMFDYSSPNNAIKNNIITQNGLTSNSYYGINIYDAASSANNIFYNNIYKNGLDGTRNYGGFATQGPLDISLDPYFKSTDPLSPDFLKLKSLANGDSNESPCIDSGDPNDTPSSQSGKRIDIGTFDLYSHSPIQGGLLAEYFDNQNFTSLKLTRIDPRINFDWGSFTPDASVEVDTFSVRWQGQIRIDYAQNYTFYITTDDGSRLWIDNQLIIDKWFDQGPQEHSATISLTPGLHDIKYEYYENGGWAVAKLYWSSPSINKALIPSDHLYYFGTLPQDTYVQGGLKGTYYKFTNFYGAPSYAFTRIDPQINFDWGGNSPDNALGYDNYSVKGKGKIKIERSDTYTFYTTTDDGVRLWVNNQLLIDAWWDQGVTERQGSIYLTPGLYDIELDYYEKGGLAACKLYWSSSTIAKSLIPPTNLYYRKDDNAQGGLYTEYFDNRDFTNPKIKRQDPNIDFDWISFSPDAYLQSDTYSIRWQGQIKIDFNETYTFYANSDDGLKLWIDNQLIINSWFDKGPYEIQASKYLTQGWHDIKVEYYENGGWASAKLSYSSPSTPKTIIPQDHLRTTLSAEDASLNLYSTLNSADDVRTPYMGHSASIIQTGTGQVTFEWAKFDKGVLLNGTSDGVNKEMLLLSSADLNKKEGTIEFWFKPNWDSYDGIWRRFLCSTYNWDGALEIFKYSNNSLYFKIVREGVQHAIVSEVLNITSPRKWNAGEWHHLAFSYGPAGMKFYLDYQELPIIWTFHGESPYTGPIPDTFASDLYLGGTYWGENPSDAIFDEIKLYNKQIIPSDTKAPIFNITSHQNNDTVNSSPVTIEGTIDDNLATVTVDGIETPALVLNGTFTTPPIPLSLGPNTVTVRATDQSSNSSSKSITLIYVDITPPTTPTVNPVISPTNIITQELSGTKEANSSIWINGAQAVPLDTLTPWSYRVDLDEGTNDFSITSKDASSNESGAVLVTIVLDTVAPTGTIKINNDDQYTKSTSVTLDLSATDTTGTGVDKMQFSDDGVSWPYLPLAYQTPYPWTLTTPGDGEKTVYARFSDVAGNWTTSPYPYDEIILDTAAPAQPVLDPVTSPTNITPRALSGTKEANSSIWINGSEAVPLDSETIWDKDVDLSEGTNNFLITSKDAAGNESQPPVEVSITLDTIAPTVAIISPENNYVSTVSPITVEGTIDDNTATVVVRVNDTTEVPAQVLDGTFRADNVPLDEGPNTIIAIATDPVENQSTSNSITVTYQPTTVLTIEITLPAEGARRVNTPTITVSGTVSDSTATVTVNNFSAVVDGNTFTAPNIPLTEGTNIITARATKDTETAEDTINVILDLDPPSINIFTPDANSTTRSNIVYGRVSDDTQTVIVNSTPAELLSDFRFIARPTLTEGANTITVEATDKAGNTNQSSINITYNTQTPKVTITSPLDNSEMNISPIKVEGTNTDDLSFILVNSQTASVIPVEAGIQNFVAEGITLSPIKTVITATGYDPTDNKFSDSIVVSSPNLSHYEITKVSGDTDEADPNRPTAGSNQILKVKLEKNSLPAVNEEIQFSVTQGVGTLSSSSIFTDINGEAQVTLTTDTDSDITNQVECYPTNNPLVKTTFYVDTKPGAPSILTKITDDTITPVPGATIDLIVKLIDQSQNPIPDEVINFQVISGDGTLSSSTAVTTYYGEAKVNLTLPYTENTSTQITVSSSTNPNLNVIFTITTSIQSTLTFDDIMAKVRENENKIQDFMADVVKTSNAPYFTPEKQFKIWSKGNKSKIQVLSPVQRTTIVETTADSVTVNGTPFFTIEKNIQDPDIATADLIESFSGDIYVLKTTITSTKGFEETRKRYIDYSKGTLIKTEREYRDPYNKRYYEVTYSYILIADTWVMNQMTIIDKDLLNNKEYTTTETRSNIIINSGIPDSVFQ